jgi:hypothetical protein
MLFEGRQQASKHRPVILRIDHVIGALNEGERDEKWGREKSREREKDPFQSDGF